MHLCFTCILYLSSGLLDLNQQQHARSIYRLHRFAKHGHQKIMKVMMLIKIIGESVKLIRSKYTQESLINMSLQLYTSYLNKHIVTLHNVSLRLLQSVNTLNSKLEFKTILINKSQQLPWSDLNFPNVCSKILLDSSTLQQFLSAIRSYMLHIPNSAEGNYLTEKENHTLCLKSDMKPKNLRITKM